MKWKIILVVMIALAVVSISFPAKSQRGTTTDVLNISEFDLTITGKKLSSINTILLDQKSFLKKFGKPLRVSIDSSEMDEDSMTHYMYMGAEAWYINDVLEAMSITSSKYSVQFVKGGSIKVGDNIRSVIKMFPGSWATKQAAGQVFVALKGKAGPVDTNLLFEYNPATNLITGISINN